MWVVMKYNVYFMFCEIFSYGEVEDYIIIIGFVLFGENGIVVGNFFGLKSNDLIKGVGFSIFFNFVKDFVNLQYCVVVEGKVEIELFDLMGCMLQVFMDQVVSGFNVFQLEIN